MGHFNNNTRIVEKMGLRIQIHDRGSGDTNYEDDNRMQVNLTLMDMLY